MSDRPAAALPPSIARTALDEIRTTVTDDERSRFASMLVSARTRSGRSLDDIAHATKISARYLDALEQGRIEQLPAGVYRRAIVRDYAAAVGLEPSVAFEQMVATFVTVAPVAAAGDVAPLPNTVAPRHAARTALSNIGVTFTPSLPSVALGLVLGVGLTTIVATSGLGYGRFVTARTPATDVPVPAATASAATPPVTGMSGSGSRGDVALPAAPQAAAPPADAPTRLVVTSTPAGARVTVDGIGWGVTPLTIRHLPPGEKVVRVTKDGYVAREQRVRVAGSAALRLTLRPRG